MPGGRDLLKELRQEYGGVRVYVPKGWKDVRHRDRLIRRAHRENVRGGTPKMKSMALLARQFRLSEKRIQDIIYG